MDPAKVDVIANWKVPTSKELVSGFLGAVGFLVDNLPCIRVPMGILHSLTANATLFRWTFTEQQAFDEIKEIVEQHRNHCRVPLDYSPGHRPIWLVTDASSASVARVVSQGDHWKTARISAFYSAKLSLMQQNYAVHELEMLAGLETMLQYRDILQGVKFTWITDHKGLVHLMKQKNITGRQAHWLEKMSEFDFDVVYIPGEENMVIRCTIKNIH
ncbi:reverse transcriptase-rnase h-integrase [Moniliophthora roreri MCA 2997]|uniref:Reverse transcriptase-rnase h-integrase n=1 Tax=Moniliophthora roreri (strain MCA 2997) TaxID=1381753 RepID=V2XP93_MONRO|nr:reverse transcriptase-rnase h-integrase [Moniliophthora roreri MCA 2997]